MKWGKKNILDKGFEDPQLTWVLRYERATVKNAIDEVAIENGEILSGDKQTLRQERATVGLSYRPIQSVVFAVALEHNRRLEGPVLLFPFGATCSGVHGSHCRHGLRILTAMRTLLAILFVLVAAPGSAQQDTTVYLTIDQASKSLFPGAQIERKDVHSTDEFREKLKAALGRVTPTVWEPDYVTFIARQNNQIVGYAIVVDEIGKVNPFTLMVSTTPDFKVRDVAVMVYRETRGGEITQKRFLAQYKGKGSSDPLLLNRDIVGISGATLSVQGANRAVHKALAVLELTYR